MSVASARLLSVRVQGFKSFAEKTQVTFGPGISAVVGPNGSGKSNLADALRWALGEQGRALSKSLGNFIDPVQVMDQLGGDGRRTPGRADDPARHAASPCRSRFGRSTP